MGFLSRWCGGSKGGAAATPSGSRMAVQEQRRQLEKTLMTPERQALIAEAMAVRRAKVALLKDLDEAGGAERVAAALRRMMEGGR